VWEWRRCAMQCITPLISDMWHNKRKTSSSVELKPFFHSSGNVPQQPAFVSQGEQVVIKAERQLGTWRAQQLPLTFAPPWWGTNLTKRRMAMQTFQFAGEAVSLPVCPWSRLSAFARISKPSSTTQQHVQHARFISTLRLCSLSLAPCTPSLSLASCTPEFIIGLMHARVYHWPHARPSLSLAPCTPEFIIGPMHARVYHWHHARPKRVRLGSVLDSFHRSQKVMRWEAM